MESPKCKIVLAFIQFRGTQVLRQQDSFSESVPASAQFLRNRWVRGSGHATAGKVNANCHTSGTSSTILRSRIDKWTKTVNTDSRAIWIRSANSMATGKIAPSLPGLGLLSILPDRGCPGCFRTSLRHDVSIAPRLCLSKLTGKGTAPSAASHCIAVSNARISNRPLDSSA